MLETLTIRNLALIDKAEIDFGRGLNVLTGETGAGKSIVVDAIICVAGGRVSKDLVRQGEDALSVTAEFTSDSSVSDWFRNSEIDEDSTIVLSRRLTADGKSTVRVNGVPVTVTQLRSLASRLIAVHGQHDSGWLVDESAHGGALDSFGGRFSEGYAARAKRYRESFAALRENERALEKIKSGERDKRFRADLLRSQIDEIESAAPSPGESAALDERLQILRNVSRLSGAFDGAYLELYGGEDSDGAAALLRNAESSLGGVSAYSERFAVLARRLTDVRLETEDVAEELRGIRSEFDFTPEELDAAELRAQRLNKLALKYGDETEALAFLESAKNELLELDTSDERRVELEARRGELLTAAEEAAADYTAAKTEAGNELRVRMVRELSALSMPNVRFETELVKNAALTENGAEDVRFLISANAGETPGRIAKIASGGELSRIMLAFLTVFSEITPRGVSVYDEIDAGVSGIAAQRVGEKLSAISRAGQVLCVTHLPQIAAMADTHFEISKSSRSVNGELRTYTEVTRLERLGSIAEIARLTGGENVTDTTLASAEEMINAAEKRKRNA
ncbi:MAG: DNA repair protein RecN [Oscillospiraceae bacterium]|jgi:DNA repair protein RecN (Recombination protein N)|nr:DNA repair protein RecN [Oscillospiraceae bacterium]